MVKYSNVVYSGRRMSKDVRSDVVAIIRRYSDTGAIIEKGRSKGNGCETVKQTELPFEDARLKLPLKP